MSRSGARNLRSHRTLREKRGLTFFWIPREKNVPADALTHEIHDMRVKCTVIAEITKFVSISLDAYSHPNERIAVRGQAPIPFCSRYVCDEALGRADAVSWMNAIVWAFPPPGVPRIIQQAIHRCERHNNLAMLVLPNWSQHIESKPWQLQILQSNYAGKMILPGSCFHRRTPGGPNPQTHLPEKDANHSFTLYFFDGAQAHSQHIRDMIKHLSRVFLKQASETSPHMT